VQKVRRNKNKATTCGQTEDTEVLIEAHYKEALQNLQKEKTIFNRLKASLGSKTPTTKHHKKDHRKCEECHTLLPCYASIGCKFVLDNHEVESSHLPNKWTPADPKDVEHAPVTYRIGRAGS
jgi:hypothetical protein